MAYLEVSFLVWMLGAIEVAGLASAWLARLSEGSPHQASCHRLFLGCLLVMAVLTMACVALGTHYWVFAGATLSVMVLAAVWDFSMPARAESIH